MRGKSGDKVRLQYILDAIIEIESYSVNTNFSGFMKNSMMRFACIKQMEIIGEAGNDVSDEVKAKFSSIEWSQIIGMRNVFVHEYFGVDPKLVWEIIKVDLPLLKEKVIKILNSLE
ncbi:MAG: DUF86 domain-containing protein [Bacteroidia bacterium]|nr:DUF86 domain-containing protein [Nitrospirota bacterium]MCX6256253.1 DUF86 domain-containing protein [Bacteroidia bacterium]